MVLLEISFQSLLNYLDARKDSLVAATLNVLGAIIFLWIGLKIINVINKKVLKNLGKTKIDATLIPFLTTLITWLLRIMLIISVAGMMGIQTTSFVAILGAAGLAVGLALQGALSNFAGGTLLLVFRPYKVGDLVEISGQTGNVTSIQIFNTLLITATNKTIILPNGPVAGGTIINYSTMGKVRVDMEFVLSGNSDLNAAREAFENLLKNHKLVLEDPAPKVKIHKFEGGDPRLIIMPWAHPDNYWTVYWDVWDGISDIIGSQENLNYPTPKMEIRMKR